jgi:predicted transposase YdaD
MDNSKLPTPHNNFFHYALSHVEAARDLIQTHLPADLVQVLDLESLELQKDSFVDDELRDSYSDLLYSVKLADHEGRPAEGQVYLLLEHKSQSDPMTCFQLLRYIVRMAYPVLDIGRIPDDSLATEPFLQSVLGLLKYRRRRDFEDKLEFLLRCLLESGTTELQAELAMSLFSHQDR